MTLEERKTAEQKRFINLGKHIFRLTNIAELRSLENPTDKDFEKAARAWGSDLKLDVRGYPCCGQLATGSITEDGYIYFEKEKQFENPGVIFGQYRVEKIYQKEK